MNWKRGSIFLAVVSLPLFYQNCAKVPLEQSPLAEEIEVHSGLMSLCLDGAYSNYTVDTLAAFNLNIVNREANYERDSDGDGLSDNEELRYGFDPAVRRTNGLVLDKICLELAGSNNCAGSIPSCTRTPNKLGLSDCDLKALQLDLLYAHPQQGLDSDKDGMVDLIEILRDLRPNTKDDLDDPDHDLWRNFEEIGRASNPFSHDGSASRDFEIITTTTKRNTGTCAGELWDFQVDRLPRIKAQAVVDDLQASLPAGALSFTHSKNANTGLVVLKLKPRPGQTGNAKILIRPLLLSSSLVNLDGNLSNFSLAGEVLP